MEAQICDYYLYFYCIQMWSALGQGAFALGYAVYKSRVGFALHQRTCAECTQPHSEATKDAILPNIHVSIIPMLHDNYAYLIVDEQSRTCLAVDPADPDRVLEAVRSEGLQLSGILTTHAHWDHAGGNEEIRSRDLSVRVYGSNVDNVAGLTDPVKEGDVFCFPPRSVTPDPQIVIQVRSIGQPNQSGARPAAAAHLHE